MTPGVLSTPPAHTPRTQRLAEDGWELALACVPAPLQEGSSFCEDPTGTSYGAGAVDSEASAAAGPAGVGGDRRPAPRNHTFA